jgi:hypothetical protein
MSSSSSLCWPASYIDEGDKERRPTANSPANSQAGLNKESKVNKEDKKKTSSPRRVVFLLGMYKPARDGRGRCCAMPNDFHSIVCKGN